MEELNLTKQRADTPPSEIIALSVATKPDELTLLEVMEILSDLCVAHPLRLLEILEESLLLPEISLAPVMAEIMSLKVSTFGKRLTQIH